MVFSESLYGVAESTYGEINSFRFYINHLAFASLHKCRICVNLKMSCSVKLFGNRRESISRIILYYFFYLIVFRIKPFQFL